MEKIVFIGAGKMATALAAGMVKGGFKSEDLTFFEISQAAAKTFSDATSIIGAESIEKALEDAGTVILAVKPQVVPQVLAQAKKYLAGKMLLSIAAGITIATLEELSGLERVIRVMPNTPALVGQGMSCFASSKAVTDDDVSLAIRILESVGRVRAVAEGQLDAVTGLSGSGPAFVMEFINALADGGVYAGLPRDIAIELAIQTVAGSAILCAESDKSIGELRDSVISPAGTTARGIMALADGAFQSTVARAVIASAERSKELAGKK